MTSCRRRDGLCINLRYAWASVPTLEIERLSEGRIFRRDTYYKEMTGGGSVRRNGSYGTVVLAYLVTVGIISIVRSLA